MDGVKNSTSVLKRASLATLGGRGTSPTSVKQPSVSLVLGHLVGKHLGVLHGVQDQEGLAEASRESSLGLSDTLLGTCHLGGVTGNEVVHDLLVGQLGNRRNDTTGITSEQNNVGGVGVGEAGNQSIGNVLNGVRNSGVLSEGLVLVVNDTGGRVENNVLKNGTEADGVENIRLLLGREVKALGVAATLNVEDTGVGPDVLVITDEETAGVSRKGSLTGTGKTEEKSDITVGALVGRRVQGQVVELDGLDVEHNSEDTLLHLTGVLSTENGHLHILEVDGNGGRRGHTVSESVGGESTGVVDGEIGLAKVGELLLSGSDKHVSHEESVVSTGTDNTDLDSVLGVPAGVSINNVDSLSGIQVVNSTLSVNLPRVLGKLLVDRSPPNVVDRGGLVDNTLVLGGATSLLAGGGNKSTSGGDGRARLVNEGILVELSGRGVVGDGDLVVVNVGGLVEFFFELSVRVCGLDTLGVERGLVNGRRHFCVNS